MGGGTINIAVEGCGHGELDKIYASIADLERKINVKVDLLIICGDFQALRNQNDMECLACPRKYRSLGSFYKYYCGEKTAPVLTLFIGGNHEASNYSQELFYGGWAAPNIFYMGSAGVIEIGGIRIGGLSGIYKDYSYRRGHFERPPYSDKQLRSIYHLREFEVFQMSQVQQPLDIFLSHDWPAGIARYGNTAELLRKKPFFRKEVEDNSLGSPPLMELLHRLQPSYWFAAHLHVKFAAVVRHSRTSCANGADDASHVVLSHHLTQTTTSTQSLNRAQAGQMDERERVTKFLALDKCLPGRDFLQLFCIPRKDGCDNKETLSIGYDPEWLAIVRRSHRYLSTSYTPTALPPLSQIVGRSRKEPSEENGGESEAKLGEPAQRGDEFQWIVDRLRARGRSQKVGGLPQEKSQSGEQKNDEDGDTVEVSAVIRQETASEKVHSLRERFPWPKNFRMTAQIGATQTFKGPVLPGNPQTDDFLSLLNLPHIVTAPYNESTEGSSQANERKRSLNLTTDTDCLAKQGTIIKSVDPNEIAIDDFDADEDDEETA